MSYTPVDKIKLNDRTPILPEGYTGSYTPEWLYKVAGLYPLKDIPIASYIYSYNKNGQTCFVTNRALCDMFTIKGDALQKILNRLKKTGILTIDYNSLGRTLTVNPPTALDTYITNEYGKHYSGKQQPNNQDIPEKQEPGNHGIPENQESTHPENQDTAYPDNQEHILKENIQMNNNSIRQAYIENSNINKAESDTQSADIWKEWNRWFKSSRSMRLPLLFMSYIKNNSEQTVKVTTRHLVRAFESGYDYASILENAFAVRYEPNPEQSLIEALNMNCQASQEFQDVTADYMLDIMEQALRDFCHQKSIDITTFRGALAQKYGIPNVTSEGSP